MYWECPDRKCAADGEKPNDHQSVEFFERWHHVPRIMLRVASSPKPEPMRILGRRQLEMKKLTPSIHTSKWSTTTVKELS